MHVCRYLILMLILLVSAGCVPQAQREVVVYTALDEPFSQPVFDAFTAETGTAVRAKFDTESTKTVGLTQAILAERERPRCDLFWNNEVVNTLRIDQAGLLASYAPLAAEEFPSQFRSPQSTWHGFAARARILLVNTERLTAFVTQLDAKQSAGPADEVQPRSILDLADPRWQGQVGMAKPLAGTTATHAACLFAVWGDEQAQEFFREVKANVQVLSGNKQVAKAVGSGELIFGLTDTDDALAEVAAGRPVRIVYPDQGADQLGTLFIPNTIALIKGGPHTADAQRLADFLLTPQVERMLAEGASGQIPLHPGVEPNGRVETPATVRAMEIDFSKAAEKWQTAAQFLRDEFATAE